MNLQAIEKAILGISALSTDELNSLTSRLEYKAYKKHERLTKEGEIENYIYYVEAGVVRNYCIIDGEDISLDFFFSGDFTSSFTSFLTRDPSVVNVEALTDTRTLRIHVSQIDSLYETSLAINKLGRKVAESLYVRRTKRELSFITQTAGERYNALLNENPHLIQLIPQKHLSTFLGISPETLSRLRKKFYTDRS